MSLQIFIGQTYEAAAGKKGRLNRGQQKMKEG